MKARRWKFRCILRTRIIKVVFLVEDENGGGKREKKEMSVREGGMRMRHSYLVMGIGKEEVMKLFYASYQTRTSSSHSFWLLVNFIVMLKSRLILIGSIFLTRIYFLKKIIIIKMNRE